MPGTLTIDPPPQLLRWDPPGPRLLLLAMFLAGVGIGIGVGHFLRTGHAESSTVELGPG